MPLKLKFLGKGESKIMRHSVCLRLCRVEQHVGGKWRAIQLSC